jgi:hypothetical protein
VKPAAIGLQDHTDPAAGQVYGEGEEPEQCVRVGAQLAAADGVPLPVDDEVDAALTLQALRG